MMQIFVVALAVLPQVARVAQASPLPLLLASSPDTVDSVDAAYLYNENATDVRHDKALIDVVANLGGLVDRADNTTTLVARHNEFQTAGLLDGLVGLPLIGGLIPIVSGLLDTVRGLLPLDSIPIVGGLLGALDAPGTNGTASAPTPAPKPDPIATAARLEAAEALLQGAAAELDKAVKIAEALVSGTSSESIVPTATTVDSASASATPTAAPMNMQEFSFSGRVGGA